VGEGSGFSSLGFSFAELEDNRKATRINNQTADDTRRTVRLIIAGTPLTAAL
jgi:hypothetical protein